MGVEALRLVVLMVEGAPLRFEKVDVELEVLVAQLARSRLRGTAPGFGRLDQVDEADLDVLDTMREAAVVSVLAHADGARVHVTELGLVLVRMVQPLDAVVAPAALVMLRAFL